MEKQSKHCINTTSFITNTAHGEAIYDPDKHRTLFVIKLNNVLRYQASYTQDNQLYKQSSSILKLLETKTLSLASDTAPYTDKATLLNEIKSFIHCYVHVSDTFETICAYYILLTWVYDQYNELPYLRVRGGYGSGKTRFLRVIGSLCYKAIFASGASTTAPLFHLLNNIQGTLILDESDFRYSDTKAELTKILNNGNAKGFSVLRCEPSKDGRFNAVSYSIFGPKIVAARESFHDDALESRFITEDMGGQKVRTGIPITLPDTFEIDALALRNKLLQYRFDMRSQKVDMVKQEVVALAGRTQQIYLPLLSLIDDKEARQLVYARIVQDESQLRFDRGLATEAELLTVMRKIQLDQKLLSITEITKHFMLSYSQRYTRRITPKWIGHLIRSKLHLATRKANGLYMIEEGQQEKLDYLMHKYDVL